MALTYNLFVACIIILATRTFWVVSVPPTPPAGKSETKRQVPGVRIAGIVNATLSCTFMLLSAYELLISEYAINRQTRSVFTLNNVCTLSVLRAPHPSRSAWFGYLVMFLGSHIRLASQRALGKFFTWEISLKRNHKLCTAGPYTFVRHPGYLGLWIVRLSVGIIQSSSGTFFNDCLSPRYPILTNLFIAANHFATLWLIIWMAFRAKWEDDLMKKHFTEEWTRWAKKTKYRVIPYVY